MTAEQDLSEDHQALLAVARIVYNKMVEEGTLAEAHRVPEYVESLMASASNRFPGVMVDDGKTKSMRDTIVAIVTQAIVNNTGVPN
jgi:hypothetical protein